MIHICIYTHIYIALVLFVLRDNSLNHHVPCSSVAHCYVNSIIKIYMSNMLHYMISIVCKTANQRALCSHALPYMELLMRSIRILYEILPFMHLETDDPFQPMFTRHDSPALSWIKCIIRVKINHNMVPVDWTQEIILFYRGVPGFAADCPCGVWCRGLITFLLYVSPLFETQV